MAYAVDVGHETKGSFRLASQSPSRLDTTIAIGQTLDIIIPERLRRRHWDGYRKTMATGGTSYGAGDLFAVPAIRKDGARISTEFTIVPFHDQTGRMLGIAAIMRDVTTRFEEMRALREAAVTKP
ncbi:MAG: PAS domain S-box protein [Acetobacteraceae bacterium]